MSVKTYLKLLLHVLITLLLMIFPPLVTCLLIADMATPVVVFCATILVALFSIYIGVNYALIITHTSDML